MYANIKVIKQCFDVFIVWLLIINRVYGYNQTILKS